MPRAELYLSTILGERTSIGLDLRECLDIWMEDDLGSLPSLSKSSKTLVVGFVHVRLIIIATA